jgi:hypothetical protein
VRVDCDRFEVKSRGGIRHEARGDLEEIVHGEKVSNVKGRTTSLARETHIESARGDIALVANDDVKLLGERVLLNC